METKPIKDVKKGDFIKRKADAATVYVRGDYSREAKAYECTDTEDMNRSIFIKGDKPVFIGFTY